MPRTTQSERRAIRRLKEQHQIQVKRLPFGKYQAFYGSVLLIESHDFKEVIRESSRLAKEYQAAKAALAGTPAGVRSFSKEATSKWMQDLAIEAARTSYFRKLLSSKP